MKKTMWVALAFALAVILPVTSAHAFSTFLGETETRLYKPEKSYNGYVTPTNFTGATLYLLDLWGNVYHQMTAKGGVPYIAEDSNIWSIGYIQDWNGNVLWSFDPSNDAGRVFTMHHDMKRIWNKKLKQYTQMILCNRTITQAEAVAAGGDPNGSYGGNRLQGYDFITEVNMNKQVVWEWEFIDHCVQNKNSAWPNYVSNTRDAPGRFDINWLTDAQRPNGQAGFAYDWEHVNSIDYNETLDHVVINPKHFSTFIVVDHGKTFTSTSNWAENIAKAAGTDGNILYRFGNPAMYNAGATPAWMTEGDQQMYGSHNIQFIQPYHWRKPMVSTDTWPDPSTYVKSGVALPGAGNFIIYDNGCYNPAGMRSRILEIDPRIGSSKSVEVPWGQYIDPAVAGYKTTGSNLKYHASNQITWMYASSSQHSFYSSHISGMQRLPNGNTSIMAGNQGQMFEVTPTGEVVWEYIWPNAAGTGCKFVASDGNNAWQTDGVQYRGTTTSFRHTRYAADFPAFATKTLTSLGTLTGRVPRLVGSTDTMYQAPVYTGVGYGSAGGVGGGGGVGSGSSGGSSGY